MVDAGNIYDRKYLWEYEFEPVAAPRNTSFARLHWKADTKLGTSVKFQIRSARDKKELKIGVWRGPSRPKSFHTKSGAALPDVPAEHRWLQYRTVFTSPDGGNTAYLREVAVECKQ